MDPQTILNNAMACGDDASADWILSWAVEHGDPWALCIRHPSLLERLIHSKVPFVENHDCPFIIQVIDALGTLRMYPEHQDGSTLLRSLQLLLLAGADLPHGWHVTWGFVPTPEQHQAAWILVQHNVHILPRLLSATVLHHFPDIIEFALANGLPLDTLSSERPLFHWMSLGGPALEILLRHGADPNQLIPIINISLLHLTQTVDQARILVQYGARPAARDSTRRTPLFEAYTNLDLVRFYIEECSVNPIDVDQFGYSLLDIFLIRYLKTLQESCHRFQERLLQQLDVIMYLLQFFQLHLLPWTDSFSFRSPLDTAAQITTAGDPRPEHLIHHALQTKLEYDRQAAEEAALALQTPVPLEIVHLIASYLQL
jgi:hypothetical protein